MRRRNKLLIAFLLFMAFAFVGSIATVAVLLRGGGTTIEKDSYLVVNLTGTLSDQPASDDAISRYFESSAPSVLEVDSALRKAAKDDRILGVILKIGDLGVGMAKVQELRDAVLRYRAESGKHVVAWAEALGNKEYYLASAADSIYMPPEGMVFFNGLAFNVTFYKGTLDKLGVEAEYARIGKYKSAVEPMTREGMSEANREMMESLASDLFERVVEGVASGRKMTREQVLAVIQDPPMTAGDARAAGLVDDLVYRDQLEDSLKPADAEEWKLTSLDDYRRVPGSSLGLGVGPKVAVIFAEGAINSGESQPPGPLGGGPVMGSDTVARAIRKARKDASIKAIVLRVDSPGGSGLASDIVWRETQLAREAGKPVVASMSDFAASGGYYISMGADAIVAQPSTLTGSIGVYAGKINLEELFQKIGVTVETIQRGPYANLFSGDRPFSPEERGKLERYIETFYRTFIEKAAEGRKLGADQVDAVARGRVWTGHQAKEIGLVDSLGGFREALRIAKEKAGIADSQEVSLVLLPEKPDFLDSLFRTGPAFGARSSAEGPAAILRTLLPGSLEGVADLLSIAPLLSSGHPLALMPFTVDVD
ncbi:signal peptide peptidase SppA [Myxococcota bacterium]|nr:signal peptide peptidase SppA [Myxococcota bacterium]